MADNTTAFKQALGVLLLGGLPASIDGSVLASNNANPERSAPADISDRERLNAPSNFLQTVSSSQILIVTVIAVGAIGLIALLKR